MMEDNWYKLQMVENAGDASKWLYHARKLYKAGIDVFENANLINPHADTTNIAYMLIGMSIECYLKSYYISCGNKLIINKNGNLETLGGHKLDEVAKNVEFELDAEQSSAVKWLGQVISYSGRYPLPTNWEKMKEYDESRLDVIQIYSSQSLHYDEIFKMLINKLEAEIMKKRNQTN